ncbi:MAG: DUF4926 domain-containing protein [Planctomycetota bacterium]|jgi:hypothetical protein
MSFKEIAPVVLKRDLPDHGLRAGDLGAVVHVHDGGELEVEFVTAAGQTLALVTLHAKDVRAVEATDVLAVRSTERPA